MAVIAVSVVGERGASEQFVTVAVEAVLTLAVLLVAVSGVEAAPETERGEGPVAGEESRDADGTACDAEVPPLVLGGLAVVVAAVASPSLGLGGSGQEGRDGEGRGEGQAGDDFGKLDLFHKGINDGPILEFSTLSRIFSGEVSEGVSGQTEDGPLVHRNRALAAVELDGGGVPVEDPPFEAPASAFEGEGGKPLEKTLAETPVTVLRKDEQVFEVEAGPSEESRIVVEEKGEPGFDPVKGGEQDFGIGAFPEEGTTKVFLGGDDLMGKLFVLGEGADEAEDKGDVLGGSRTVDDVWHRRLYSGLRDVKEGAGEHDEAFEGFAILHARLAENEAVTEAVGGGTRRVGPERVRDGNGLELSADDAGVVGETRAFGPLMMGGDDHDAFASPALSDDEGGEGGIGGGPADGEGDGSLAFEDARSDEAREFGSVQRRGFHAHPEGHLPGGKRIDDGAATGEIAQDDDDPDEARPADEYTGGSDRDHVKGGHPRRVGRVERPRGCAVAP